MKNNLLYVMCLVTTVGFALNTTGGDSAPSPISNGNSFTAPSYFADPVVTLLPISPEDPTASDVVTLNARVDDTDNDVVSVVFQYNFVSQGFRFNQTAATRNNGDGTYSADIPPRPAGSTVFYRVTATDSNGGQDVATGNYTVATAAGLQVQFVDQKYRINFEDDVQGINRGLFTGSGFNPDPSAGQLDSDGIIVVRNNPNQPNKDFGDVAEEAFYTRGQSTGGETAGGVYSFDTSNGVGAANYALGLQVNPNNLTPGSIMLRFENRTGTTITQLSVSYEVASYDDGQPISFNLSYGQTQQAINNRADLNFVSFEEMQNSWTRNAFETKIFRKSDGDNIAIAPGDDYYLVWTTNDVAGGSGARSEIALDNIVIIANPVTTTTVLDGNYDSVIVDGRATINNPVSILRSLELTGGRLNTNGQLTFESTEDRSAILKEVTNFDSRINGGVVVEQYYPANRAFRFISSPLNSFLTIFDSWQLSGQETEDFGTQITGGLQSDGFDQNLTGNPSLFEYDNVAAEYRAFTSANGEATNRRINSAGQPYRILIRGDRTVTITSRPAPPTPTTLINVGELVIGPIIDRFPNAREGNFVLIGNPYQAQVNLDRTLRRATSTDLNTNFYYYYQPRTENFVTYDFAQGGTQNGVTNAIQPSQSFFAMVENDGRNATINPSITFEEDQKLDASLTTETYSVPTEPSLTVRVGLNASDSTEELDTDFIVTRFNSDGLDEIDSKDARKLAGFSEQLYIINNDAKFSIESRNEVNENTIIQLGLSDLKATSYDLSVNLSNTFGTQAILNDTYLNTSKVLNSDGLTTVTFDVDANNSASYSENRFNVTFSKDTLSNDEPVFGAGFAFYPNPVSSDVLRVSGLKSGLATVEVINLLGQTVISDSFTVTSNNVELNGFSALTSGVYLVKVSQDGQSMTKKVAVN